jgi:hypothetical protein
MISPENLDGRHELESDPLKTVAKRTLRSGLKPAGDAFRAETHKTRASDSPVERETGFEPATFSLEG